MTSDYDVCEIDLDMQMSFLNAAPFDSMWRGAPKEWRRLEQKLGMGDVGREIKQREGTKKKAERIFLKVEQVNRIHFSHAKNSLLKKDLQDMEAQLRRSWLSSGKKRHEFPLGKKSQLKQKRWQSVECTKHIHNTIISVRTMNS